MMNRFGNFRHYPFWNLTALQFHSVSPSMQWCMSSGFLFHLLQDILGMGVSAFKFVKDPPQVWGTAFNDFRKKPVRKSPRVFLGMADLLSLFICLTS